MSYLQKCVSLLLLLKVDTWPKAIGYSITELLPRAIRIICRSYMLNAPIIHIADTDTSLITKCFDAVVDKVEGQLAMRFESISLSPLS
jgi:hypothetical protein